MMNLYISKGHLSYEKRLGRTGFLIILPVLLYFAFVYWFPLFDAFKMSFDEMIPGSGMKFAGFKTYKEVLLDPEFWLSLKNTFMFTIISVLFTILLALIISISLNNVWNFILRDSLLLMYILPSLVSFAAAGFIWEWLYHPKYGFIHQAFSIVGLSQLKFLTDMHHVIPSQAVINIWVRVGFSVLILFAGLQGLPKSYFDAAKVDGVSGLKLYRYITLPLLAPQIGAVTLLEVIYSLKVFDVVYVTTGGGPAGASEVMMLYLYNNAFKFYRFDKSSVVAVFIFLLLMIFSVIQRKLTRGGKYDI